MYGRGYSAASVSIRGSLCLVSGLIRATRGLKNPITTLPPNCRPNKRLIFNINNNENTLRVDVTPRGDVGVQAGKWRHGWVNLDGIVFATKRRKALKLQSKWTNFGGRYGSVTYTRSSGGVCEVEGVARGNKWGLPFANLPSACRPRKRLIFSVNNHERTARVDVLRSGRIVWVAGGRSHGWLSLSGIVFNTHKGSSVRTLNGWRNYGGRYGGVTIAKVKSMCFLNGLVRGGKWGKPMVRLPLWCRPTGRMIFNVNNHVKNARVDVTPSGTVKWVAGGRGHGWLSLTGISFGMNYIYNKYINVFLIYMKL